MYKNGVLHEIVMDNYVPCIDGKNGPVPAFSHGRGNELWVIILEKAWAKVHGSYQRIETR